MAPPAAATMAKTGVRSLSQVLQRSGRADTFLDDRIDAIRQRSCQGCAFPCERFSARTFSSYWLQNLTEATKMGTKICFGEKLPINASKLRFKILLRNDTCGQWFAYFCQVSWKSVNRKWPKRCVAFVAEKGQYFAPFSGRPALLERSRRKFYRITFSLLHIPLPSFVQIHPVYRELHATQKYLLRSV